VTSKFLQGQVRGDKIPPACGLPRVRKHRRRRRLTDLLDPSSQLASERATRPRASLPFVVEKIRISFSFGVSRARAVPGLGLGLRLGLLFSRANDSPNGKREHARRRRRNRQSRAKAAGAKVFVARPKNVRARAFSWRFPIGHALFHAWRASKGSFFLPFALLARVTPIASAEAKERKKDGSAPEK